MRSLQSLHDIQNFFHSNRTPLFYANSTSFNLLGADEWLHRLKFINTINSFDGQHPNVFVPAAAHLHGLQGIEAANHYLLQHKAVVNYIHRVGTGGMILFLMFDEETEQLSQQMGLTVCFPPANLRRYLDSKVTTTQLANRAGIASVPNVLAKVESYAALRKVAKALGPDLVVQLPYGDSGNTTFFISTEADFRPYARQIASQPLVKIMRRIHCRQVTIEGCVTRHGILVGPLMTELIGFEELTPYRGGWCGNEIFAGTSSPALPTEIRQQAQQATLAIGEQLKREGYWGYFGLDFLLDQESGELYLGEMNPRITGATPLTSQAALDRHVPPLLAYHLLEGLQVDYRMDVEQFNQEWLRAEQLTSWSQMIIEHTGETADRVTHVPPSGIWRMGTGGSLHFSRPAFQMQAIADESEALLLRTVDAGHTPAKGNCIGRLITQGRLLTDEYELNERAKSWIRGIRAHFAAQPIYEAVAYS